MPADDVLDASQRFGIGGGCAHCERIWARNDGRSPVGEDQPATQWLAFDLLDRNLVAQVGKKLFRISRGGIGWHVGHRSELHDSS
jgi:hypothetical protein